MIRLDRYPRPTRITEDILLGVALARQEEARPCVCGGVIVASRVDPTAAVRTHQLEPRHEAWRERCGL